VIAAQEAYQRHLELRCEGRQLLDLQEPGNFMKAQRKAMREIRKAAPFKIKVEEDEDEDEKEGD
jgi:hypothetical protein